MSTFRDWEAYKRLKNRADTNSVVDVLKNKSTGDLIVRKIIYGIEQPLYQAVFTREMRALYKLNKCSNIVNILGDDYLVISTTKEKVGVIYLEYINGIELGKSSIENFSANERFSIIKQLLDAIEISHSNGIIHRDINPNNIMLTDDKQVKLIDFGICKINDMISSATVYKLGTNAYSAPEVHQHSENATEKSDLSYYRYVDDILILVNEGKFFAIKKEIAKDINELGLELNEKKDEGKISEAFEYLGYTLSNDKVSVRKSSILKLEQSMEDLFGEVKKENIEYLKWKLNLKITGFILGKQKYGWMFFYSQITDVNLLFHLDDVVQKLLKRYKLDGELHLKKFVRVYWEIKKALYTTKYIPNLDNLKLEERRKILSDIYQMDLTGKDEHFVEIQFRKIMKREIRDIERDIESIS